MLTALAATLLLSAAAPTAAARPAGLFDNVPASSPLYADLAALDRAGLLDGVQNLPYRQGERVSRFEMAQWAAAAAAVVTAEQTGEPVDGLKPARALAVRWVGVWQAQAGLRTIAAQLPAPARGGLLAAADYALGALHHPGDTLARLNALAGAVAAIDAARARALAQLPVPLARRVYESTLLSLDALVAQHDRFLNGAAAGVSGERDAARALLELNRELAGEIVVLGLTPYAPVSAYTWPDRAGEAARWRLGDGVETELMAPLSQLQATVERTSWWSRGADGIWRHGAAGPVAGIGLGSAAGRIFVALQPPGLRLDAGITTLARPSPICDRFGDICAVAPQGPPGLHLQGLRSLAHANLAMT
ncbi:MAG TPA: hypothetical protein VFK80_01490 [Limnochordia bacterium]|nr:hypothetical protein [Limnochordia bacterium]